MKFGATRSCQLELCCVDAKGPCVGQQITPSVCQAMSVDSDSLGEATSLRLAE